jgi:hypothetical protein
MGEPVELSDNKHVTSAQLIQKPVKFPAGPNRPLDAVHMPDIRVLRFPLTCSTTR